jgi:hypothetical protein
VAPTNPDDQAAWIWIGGAKNVNANSGAFASYIRNYTAEQYLLRTGQNIPGGVGTDPDGLIQAASDKIAQRFVASLFGKLDDPNGNPEAVIDGEFTSLTLPDLDTIGRIDAGAAASGIFASTSPDGMKNYSPWAGTLLFTRLNDPSFFQNWVLTKDANTFKKETGTYDLATIA